MSNKIEETEIWIEEIEEMPSIEELVEFYTAEKGDRRKSKCKFNNNINKLISYIKYKKLNNKRN